MTDPIDLSTVRELCHLAKLRLEPVQAAVVVEQINALLVHFATLQAVPTATADATKDDHPQPLLRLRTDHAEPPLGVAATLAGTAKHQQEQFQVPRVIEE